MESVIIPVPNYQRNLYSNLREPKISPVSKSNIYSIVAAIFDPLGLISPVIVVYKNFPAAVVAAQASLG